MMLVIRPELVDMSKAVKGPDTLLGNDLPCPSLSGPGVYAVASVTATREGIYGDASRAEARLGEAVLNVLADATAKVIREMASVRVPDQWKAIHALIPVPNNE